MESFKSFLTEKKIRKQAFSRFPKLGWWMDNDPITFFHGTHIRNIGWVEANGLVPPKEGYTAGIVSLALEPNTAWGYASMSGAGGEAEFRSAGQKVTTTSQKERVVFVLEIPKSYILKKMLPLNYATSVKLNDKAEYDKWTKDDQLFYALTEVKHKGAVPSKYIKAYMTK